MVAPIVASCGVVVPKMSGRGLGHTGGTVDKLEAIPGFQTAASHDEFQHLLKTHQMALVGQTQDLAPADKQIYALRDVTATVESIPLIASSVMSKKIAAGAKGIVLDVKVGSGAFMKTVDEATALAETMVTIGTRLGRKTIALLTNMDQPLGRTVGNLLEVEEAIETLRGGGPEDLTELSVLLSTHMLMSVDDSLSFDQAKEKVDHAVQSGDALERFIQYAVDRGASADAFDDFAPLYEGVERISIYPTESGYLHRFDAQLVGKAAMRLGAGRAHKDSIIDPAVGIRLFKKVGDPLHTDEPWAEMYVKETSDVRTARDELQQSITINQTPPDQPTLLFKTIQ
nr:thymidine phosphorylase [Litoribacterium kuwaitense]